MSSNIGPEANAAYQKYLDAKLIAEKIKNLEDFLSLIPKHKATEKIVALNKSRLSKLKRQQEDESQRLKSIKKQATPFSIKKEGLQLILISDFHTPGVGKTSLLNYLTGAAKKKIGRFTPLPEIGIFRYRKIRYQIVDMPSLMKDAASGVGNGKEILSQVRACDLICLCIDLSRDDDQVKHLMTELSNAGIRINIPPPPINIKKTGANKIQVMYLSAEAKDNENMGEFTEQVREIVLANGVKNAIIKIYGKISLDDLVDTLSQSVVYKSAIIIATKGDLPHTGDTFKKITENYAKSFPLIIGTSVKKNNFPDDFGEIVLKFLDKIKIYTMNAGRVADKPLIIDNGSTIKDVALKIHRSFYELFDHAVVIRKSSRQKRKKVGLDYELIDEDIIELHTI